MVLSHPLRDRPGDFPVVVAMRVENARKRPRPAAARPGRRAGPRSGSPADNDTSLAIHGIEDHIAGVTDHDHPGEYPVSQRAAAKKSIDELIREHSAPAVRVSFFGAISVDPNKIRVSERAAKLSMERLKERAKGKTAA